MTLRTRLILTIGGVALLLAVPAIFAVLSLDRLQDIANGVRSGHGTANLALGRLQTNLTEVDRLERVYISFPDDSLSARTAAQRDSALSEARSQLAVLARAGYDTVSQPARSAVDRIEQRIAYVQTLLDANNRDAATDEVEVFKQLKADADSAIDRIAAEIDHSTEQQLEEAGNISSGALTTTILALVASLFIAVLLGTWATRTVVHPIHRLRRAMAAVAAGEFMVPEGLPYDRTDEIGDLSRSFRAMTQHLADLDQMKADFMSVATHELKTPINVISGYAELIHEGLYGPLTPKQEDALIAMQEQTHNLTQLINQLLDISRLEAGGLRLEINDIHVPDLLDRLRRTFDGMAHRQQIELHMDLADSAPQVIPGDADRLRDQVFGNLLSNALKFTPEGGQIRVQAYGSNSSLVVEVSDTGPGIPADQLPHVFDKYYQIGEQARSKGAGLGLTIAHDVVEAHGGEVSVESIEGRGTTFRIELPTERDKVEQARRVAASTSAER